MPDNFALITGASSGIGLEMARLLAQRGYHLLLVSNQEAELKKLQLELAKEFNKRVEILPINLATAEAAKAVFDYCNSKALNVEVLINNAGFFFFGQIADADYGKATAMMLLHVVTLSQMCTLFGAQMKERRKGYILNTSSISAYKSFPGIGYYGSTKAYIKSFTQSLHTELKHYGVHVTCLSPGATATNLYDPNVINVELGKKVGVMMNAQKVAAAGIEGLFKNKAVVVPGLLTKLMLFFARLTPQWLIYQIRIRSRWLK
ncbi:MAG: SDR family NAD(P)-dependent oxidoreductase [Chitinophagales bacterium]